MALSITTPSIILGLYATLRKSNSQLNVVLNVVFFYSYTVMLSIVMLSITLLSIIMLSIILLIIVMLRINMLSIIKRSIIMISIVMLIIEASIP
jgi:hypothetical protein